MNKDSVEAYVKSLFNEKQYVLIEKYVDEILDIVSNVSIKGYSMNERILAIIYYVIRKECIPLSVNLILRNVRMSTINRILKKYGLSIPLYNSEEKVKRYLSFLSEISNEIKENEKVISNEVFKVLSLINGTVNELALVCAVIFKLGIMKESELCEITGLSDGTIRNYRRVLENLNVR